MPSGFEGSRFRNVPTEADEYAANIAVGRIINVRYKNYSVDVQTESSGAVYENVQLGMSYFHYENGEGIYALPEVGAQCVIVIPSESSDPFVLCFLALTEDTTPAESSGTSTEDESQDQAEAEEDEELPPPVEEVDMTYKNRRPLMRPGDICFRGRDENFVFLRRGGVVQIGASPIAQRIYIPVRNFIKDFAENYNMDLAGGKVSWELVHEDDDHNASVHRFVWREYAEQASGSVSCAIGQLGDDYFDFVIAPEAINATTGEVSGDVKIRIRFSKEGELIRECQKETITVNGDRKIVISGKHEEECNEYSQKVSGKRKVEFQEESKSGTKSVESVQTKEIRGQSVKLGDGTYSAVNGEILMAYLVAHSHPQIGLPPATPPPPNLLSTKVKV